MDNFSPNFDNIPNGVLTIIIAIAFIILFIFLGYITKKWLSSRLSKKMADPLLAGFIAGFFQSIILIIGLLIILRVFGLGNVVTNILAGAGITAFIIGFALKDIGENFLSGILLAFKRPFRVGDIVEISGQRGKVLTLNLRDTQIKTEDGKDVFIPNANIIKNPLVNFTLDGFLRYDFKIGLDYDPNFRKAIECIEKSLSTVKGILVKPKKPTVYLSEIAGRTLTVHITFWVNTYSRILPDLKVKSEAIISVLTDLEKEGFTVK